MPNNFDEWWDSKGRFLDPDTDDVPWFDKRKELARYAYEAAKVAEQPVGSAGFHAFYAKKGIINNDPVLDVYYKELQQEAWSDGYNRGLEVEAPERESRYRDALVDISNHKEHGNTYGSGYDYSYCARMAQRALNEIEGDIK